MRARAVEIYGERVRAVAAQRARLGLPPRDVERWSRSAPGYRFDPLRPLDENLAILASYVQPDDVVLEVGGGAGRIGLPLALRCREVINVEPAAGMREAFEALATEAKISNASTVASTWEAAPRITADVALTVDVTYFVEQIEPFVRYLQSAARRRTIISLWSVPPPNWNAALFELVHQERQELLPGVEELLPALWAMGLLPDVRVLPGTRFDWPVARLPDREAAIRFALEAVDASNRADLRARVARHVRELFRVRDGLFEPAWRPEAREVLITWSDGIASGTPAATGPSAPP